MIEGVFLLALLTRYNSSMSWAARRKTAYATGVFIFFAAIIGLPLAYWYFSTPASCSDGKRNQGETAVDRGGPCPLLDSESLNPTGLLWTRSFRVRDGAYSSVAYIQNPNSDAGVRSVHYRFSLYDERNIFVTERTGTAFIMPGSVTAIFEGNIETGSRVVSHTYFEFQETPKWEKLEDTSIALQIKETAMSDTETVPRLTAAIENTSVRQLRDIKLVAIISDPAGNAFTASQTAVPILGPGETQKITFTWPTPFNLTVGRVAIIPLSPPRPAN